MTSTGTDTNTDTDKVTETAPADKAALKDIDPSAPLPRIITDLSAEEITERLSRANYRGRLPEIDWPEPGRRFTFDILGHRMEHDILGTLSQEKDHTRIDFTVSLKRRPIWMMIIVIIISTPVGAYFMDIVPLLDRIPYPWVWFPIVNIGFSAWWLINEIRQTVRMGWSEAKRYINKVAAEIEGKVQSAEDQ